MAVDVIDFSADADDDEAERVKVYAEWQKVMATFEGRRVLSYILRDLGLFSTVVGERTAGKHEAAILFVDHMRSVNNGLLQSILTELLSDERSSQF